MSSDAPEANGDVVDPLDRVAIATNVWRKAAAAWPERADRDRAIIAAFEAGRNGTDIAAASGPDLAEVYLVHRRADQIKSDDELERRMQAMKDKRDQNP